VIKLLIIWFASKSLNISELTLYKNDVNFFSIIVNFLWNLMCLSVDMCFSSHCSAWFVKFFSWYLLIFKILRISVMFLKVEYSSSSWEFWYLIVIFFLRRKLVIMMSRWNQFDKINDDDEIWMLLFDYVRWIDVTN